MFKWIVSFFTFAQASWVRKPRRFEYPRLSGDQEYCPGDYLKSRMCSRRESRMVEESKKKKQKRTQNIILLIPVLLYMLFILIFVVF